VGTERKEARGFQPYHTFKSNEFILSFLSEHPGIVDEL
jgi:hypothetical protein